MIEIGAITTQATNLTIRNVDEDASIDHSYRRMGGKNIAQDVASTSMGFDDFIDMINPLEHIPVVSSIYRAITGETINPVSRIAGDTLYGSILGIASVGIAAVGAIGDEIVSANNDGQSASGFVLASLFGDETANDSEKTIQLADASARAETAASGAIPSLPATVPVADKVKETSAPTTVDTKTAGMMIDRSKLPFGGVIDATETANAQENQAIAMAMASQRSALQAQKSLHNNRFAASTPATPTPQPTVITDSARMEPETQTAMQNLLKELQGMKSIGLYATAAQNAVGSSETGARINVVN